MEANLNSEREIQNFNELMMEFALESVGLMFIGTRLGVLQGSHDGKVMIEHAHKIFDILLPLTVTPPAIVEYTPMFKDFSKSVAIMYEIGDRNIKAAKAKHEVDGSLTGTILGRLIDRCGPDSPIPTVMASDALGAGIDTTGNASALFLHHLAMNPDKQDILYEEVVRVVGKDGLMTEAKLLDMRYLKACLQESMRMIPIAHTTARQTKVDLVLGGYQVPKDTLVIRHNAVISNEESFYKQADKFIPERWLRGCPAHEKVDAYTNLPFGHGPRSCVGQRFARLELYMLAFKIVQKYKIECNGLPVEVDYTGLAKAVNEVNIKLTPRK